MNIRALLIGVCGIAAGLGLAFIISISNPSKAPAESPSKNTTTPEGVVNYVPGPGAEIGEYLVKHPQVHGIAFTGSLAVGKRISELEVGYTLKTAIAQLRSCTQTPLLTGLPFGHVATVVSLPVGARARLLVQGRDALLGW